MVNSAGIFDDLEGHMKRKLIPFMCFLALALPLSVFADPDKDKDKDKDKTVKEKTVPAPATMLLLGAAVAGLYGTRKFWIKGH
jgi:PEP-CTERM motif